MNEVALIAFAGVFVMLGAVSQRTTGVGFALVASPGLVLALGAVDGVRLANLLSIVSALFVLTTVFRHVEWRRALLLSLPGLALGVPAGSLLAIRADSRVVLIVLGALVLLSLALIVRRRRTISRSSWMQVVAAGTASGFMNAAAGLGGPALVTYSRSIGWHGSGFIATTQVCLIAMNIASLGFKGLPTVGSATLAAALVALATGSVLGHLLTRRLPVRTARTAVLIIAGLGGAFAIVRGVLGYFG